jgi:hypothetical protein
LHILGGIDSVKIGENVGVDIGEGGQFAPLKQLWGGTVLGDDGLEYGVVGQL